jgi:hypothetical protein
MGRIAVDHLAKALSHGQVVWDDPDRPRVLVPPMWHDALSDAAEEVREVLRRAALFRRQANSPGAVPILALPDAPLLDGACISCGGAKDGPHRCLLCRVAAWVALGWLGGPKQ